MKLSDLAPKLSESPLGAVAQRLDFLCPLCRKRRISVDIWHAPAGEAPVGDHTIRVWHATQGPLRDWDTLTLTPSINHEHGLVTPERPCPGWHGFITNGEAA